MSQMLKLWMVLILVSSFSGLRAQQSTGSVQPHNLNLASFWKKKEQKEKEKEPKKANPDSVTTQSDEKPAEEVKPEMLLEGYVDAYYALSTDSNSYNPGAIDLFQSVGPRNNQFGLNVARLRTTYTSKNVRGTVSMFWGDIPRYSWSLEAPYNNIQEANVGVRLAKGLWLDAGFFTTHVGGELLLPKDNMMSTISYGTFHEPFFMAGATLTWEASPKFTGKLVFANDYYFFSDPNALGNKAFGLLATFKPVDYVAITYNNILLNLAAAGNDETKFRFYNNINVAYNRKRLQLLASVDFGTQSNVVKDTVNTVGTAFFISGEFAAKYRFVQKAAVYSRIEFFNDVNGAISNLGSDLGDARTRPFRTRTGGTEGLQSWGFTFGGEVNPASNSYIRLEGRIVNLANQLEWFKALNGDPTYQRLELLFTFGVNFTSGNLIR